MKALDLRSFESLDSLLALALCNTAEFLYSSWRQGPEISRPDSGHDGTSEREESCENDQQVSVQRGNYCWAIFYLCVGNNAPVLKIPITKLF